MTQRRPLDPALVRRSYAELGRAVYRYMERWQAPTATRALGQDRVAENAAQAVRGYYRQARERWQAGDREGALVQMQRAAEGVAALQRYAQRASSSSLASYAASATVRDLATAVEQMAERVRHQIRDVRDAAQGIGIGLGLVIGIGLLVAGRALAGGGRR